MFCLNRFVDQKPQWASVQPRPFQVIQKTAESPQDQQRVQLIENQKQGQGRSPQQRYQPPPPEYGTYNTAGVPLSQLRKMQLSEDDRALMDKFKQQGNFLKSFSNFFKNIQNSISA